ncbi:MAG: metal-dependent hydrolase [Balneolaceae bacterium]|nr:metal-dependent hydrolase [Balneolaceae bacterium]
MDTITQITLGAAVGEALLGKKAGYKAPLWGAVFGVAPDLDILANPFLTDVQEIIAHRGISHSILLCVTASPVFGWLLSRVESNRDIGWKSWSWLVFWVVATHIFIDVCTSYGTQVFQPFSNYAATFNSIFIIDPFYTLPLLTGIVYAVFAGNNLPKRRWANYLGLAISTLYLVAGFGINWHVNTVFEENFRQQGLQVERYMTTPAPLTTFLWTGYAEGNDTIYAGLYSVFDEEQQIRFREIPKRTGLIRSYRDDLAIQRLLWFSNGYYTVQRNGEELIFTDLRFGRTDLWITDRDAPYVWNYRLRLNDDSTAVVGFEQFEPSFSTGDGAFTRLFNRILGIRF